MNSATDADLASIGHEICKRLRIDGNVFHPGFRILTAVIGHRKRDGIDAGCNIGMLWIRVTRCPAIPEFPVPGIGILRLICKRDDIAGADILNIRSEISHRFRMHRDILDFGLGVIAAGIIDRKRYGVNTGVAVAVLRIWIRRGATIAEFPVPPFGVLRQVGESDRLINTDITFVRSEIRYRLRGDYDILVLYFGIVAADVCHRQRDIVHAWGGIGVARIGIRRGCAIAELPVPGIGIGGTVLKIHRLRNTARGGPGDKIRRGAGSDNNVMLFHKLGITVITIQIQRDRIGSGRAVHMYRVLQPRNVLGSAGRVAKVPAPLFNVSLRKVGKTDLERITSLGGTSAEIRNRRRTHTPVQSFRWCRVIVDRWCAADTITFTSFLGLCHRRKETKDTNKEKERNCDASITAIMMYSNHYGTLLYLSGEANKGTLTGVIPVGIQFDITAYSFITY